MAGHFQNTALLPGSAPSRLFGARLRPGDPSLRRFDGRLNRFDAMPDQNGG
jgi:hypothetical protein